MTYVDGYVLAVPTAKREDYRKVAETCARVFKKHGALGVMECWADDVPDGKLTSFPMAVKCQDDESVVFAWALWPSRAARDVGNSRVIEELGTMFEPGDMPFDGKRMIFGGFEPIVEA